MRAGKFNPNFMMQVVVDRRARPQTWKGVSLQFASEPAAMAVQQRCDQRDRFGWLEACDCPNLSLSPSWARFQDTVTVRA
jgi:hypothetical protein